ncbi:HDOD domain-containing protein [Thauera mechernichensis]|uniref:HDOD domain-containing protein n=1 Tax=Thauera mechernichensis TaxID=82788 RepID=A0ABW3WF71_9RHOO|nr:MULTISPECIES: HDOD domain-containing protein [Thauera]ENO80871.1 signal transduction protein [Thauera sp. 27]ENO92246.1 signal transduction protein [Thauera sp. 28]MDG3065105.1 HDOD domain-containing protein [Thauera mechernichensis]WBL62472.1 HDOD domain-containing protein [Thauera sp. WB-2]HAY10148.1 HDOD domain-containing protein [Thauera sp.]
MEEFESQTEAFAQQIEEELRDGVLSFPTVFDLSLRIKKMADDPDSSLSDIAEVVRAEPVLAAKVLRMANTVALNPYRGEINSVGDAIGRIGLSALRCLAYAVAAEQLARDHRSRQMRLVASGLWMHSIDVASWAFAFSRHLGRHTPDTALLAGLMINVGQFYLLARAARYPAIEGDMKRFAEIVSLWDDPVRSAVLDAFEMPALIVDACEADPVAHTEWPPAAMGDIVFFATLAAETPNPFESLLGVQRRPELLDASLGEAGKEAFDALLVTARDTRQEMLAAVCG